MSFIIENRPTTEINNKDREQFLYLEMKEDFSFKYIPESHFKHIVKNVQRQRRKEDEERIWTTFVKEQELNSLQFHNNEVDHPIQNVKDLFLDNIQYVDRELKRLAEDSMPEGSKEIQHHVLDIKNEKTGMQINSTRSNSPIEKFLAKDNGTYSTDFLMPVTEDNNLSGCKKPDGLKTVFRSKPKKSLSDSSITEKKCYTNELLRVTNHFENNSDTDSNNYKDDIVYVQPDPVTIQKLLSMQKRIAELLDEISFRLCRIPLPDGDNDLKRRQQQTFEFGIRFSRNYLYNLSRLVTSIQRHIRTVSVRAGLKQYHRAVEFHQDMIKQKLVAAHQLLIQALNAYYKQIPNSVLNGHSTKLQDVLQIVCNLQDICNKVEISANYFCSGDTPITPSGKHLQDKCDAILSKLKYNSEGKGGSAGCKSAENMVGTAPVPLQNKKRSQKNLSSRLSMYSIDVNVSKGNQKKRNDLRRKSQICQKEAGNKSKDIKNMGSQHNSLPELLYPSPVTRTSSSKDIGQINTKKSMNYVKEDDIRTMMDEVTIDSENDSNVENQSKQKSASNVEHSPKILPNGTPTQLWRAKSVYSKETNDEEEHVTMEGGSIGKVTTISKDHLSKLVLTLDDVMSVVPGKQVQPAVQPVPEPTMGTLKEFLQKYCSTNDAGTGALLTCDNLEQINCGLNSMSETQRRGENVQLVCVSSMDKVSKAPQYDVSCQADCKISQKAIKDKKIADLYVKDGIDLIVSKQTELQLLAFKRDYKNLCLSKPMYYSNTENKPWDIVAWISDKLIDELIIEITEELQMGDIIKKLFEMEFQEF